MPNLFHPIPIFSKSLETRSRYRNHIVPAHADVSGGLSSHLDGLDVGSVGGVEKKIEAGIN